MAKKTINLITIIVLILTTNQVFALFRPNKTIADYQPIFIPLFDNHDNLKIAIRKYSDNGNLKFLTVDPDTLKTTVLLEKQTNIYPTSIKKDSLSIVKTLEKTEYIKLLDRFSKPPYLLENYGLTNGGKNFNGIFLTVDMCPSSKPFEKKLFEALKTKAKQLKHPLPIGISISGLWILKHKGEFKWLIDQQKGHNFDITWINHSFSHSYYKYLSYDKNFLLYKPEHFIEEVLATEKLLLEYGQIPSVYLRFPGLVADKNLIIKLNKLGLIPIGTDSWIAKNQKPVNGSIILIHGNGNEVPKAIDRFLGLLDQLKFLNL